VGSLVFKTSERRAASLAGSIPVRLRHQPGQSGFRGPLPGRLSDAPGWSAGWSDESRN
jgi:hypothetical protein